MNTNGQIVIWGDLRTQRHWHNSLKVMAKGRDLAATAQASVAMVLIGAGSGSPQAVPFDPAACVDMDEAAGQGASHGADIVHCLEHPDLLVPRTDVYARVLAEYLDRHHPC